VISPIRELGWPLFVLCVVAGYLLGEVLTNLLGG
jgi:hypothetical protein